MTTIELRPATREDVPFLRRMLLEAVNWDPHRPPLSPDAAMASHDIAHYVDHWPGRRDAGVVADRAGAAWWTYFDLGDPGYGFVSPDVPEVTIAVVAEQRGRGLGRRLLTALHDLAEARGVERLSLSVEKANRAANLYRSLGYEVVADDGAAWTMVVQLRSAVDDDPG